MGGDRNPSQSVETDRIRMGLCVWSRQSANGEFLGDDRPDGQHRLHECPSGLYQPTGRARCPGCAGAGSGRMAWIQGPEGPGQHDAIAVAAVQPGAESRGTIMGLFEEPLPEQSDLFQLQPPAGRNDQSVEPFDRRAIPIHLQGHLDPARDLIGIGITDWAAKHPAHVVMAWAGHSDFKTTNDYYLQISESEYDNAAGSKMFESNGKAIVAQNDAQNEKTTEKSQPEIRENVL
jgi:hypothetical protein